MRIIGKYRTGHHRQPSQDQGEPSAIPRNHNSTTVKLMEFRFGCKDDIEELCAMVGQTFDDGPQSKTAQLQKLAYQSGVMDPELCWLATHNGEIIARWQAIDHRLAIRGVSIPAAGALGIAIAPEHRNLAFSREFTSAGRPEIRARGYPVQIGFVESGALWSAMGGASIQCRYHAKIDTSHLRRRTFAGEFLPSSPEELVKTQTALDEIVARHNRNAHRQTGSLLREPMAWAYGRHRPPELLRFDQAHAGIKRSPEALHIYEAQADDAEAYATMLYELGHLARSQGVALTADLPPHHPLLAAAQPYGLEICTHWPRRSQGMGALEDAQALVDILLQDKPLDLELHWIHELPAETIEYHSETTGPRALGLHTRSDPGTLLQLLVGHQSANALLTQGRLKIKRGCITTLEQLWPTTSPFTYLSDRF